MPRSGESCGGWSPSGGTADLANCTAGAACQSRAVIEAVERDAGLGAPARGRAATELYASDGSILCGHEARLARWREHFAQLFAEESHGDLEYISRVVPQRRTRPEFDAVPTRAEYAEAVRSLKNGKAAGEDGVVAELLRAGGTAFHDRFYDLVRACWENEEVPAAWRNAVMLPLPKGKGDVRLCDNWRGISLLSVPGKVVARLAATRITRIAEGVLHESANGFRPGRGTMDCVGTNASDEAV